MSANRKIFVDFLQNRIWKLFFGCILLGEFLLGTLFAQQAPPDIPAVTLRVTSQLVLVDVVVKDNKGRPAEGLTPADFSLFEDGKPQRIATFSFEQPLQAGVRPPVLAGTPLPPSVYTNRPEYSRATGPCTVLLLDALNTPTQDQRYARQQMLRYLEKQLQSNQRMAVFALGQSLQLLQDFTDDPRLLKAAVESFKPDMSLELLLEDVDKRMPLASRQTDTGRLLAIRAGRLSALREFYEHQAEVALRTRVSTTLSAFKMIASNLAAYPGRKNLIWVSASFPIRLQSMGSSSFATELQKMSQLLTDARVAIYPVDARGLVGVANLIPVFDASSPGTNDMGGLFTGPQLLDQIFSRQMMLQSTQDSMKLLASQTGGLALINRNDLDRAVSQIVADGSAYYVLGYYRKDKTWDGKFHTTKVKVARAALTARHRQGFLAIGLAQWEKQNERVRDADLRLAMMPGSPPSSMIIFDVRVTPPASASRLQVPVEVLVDPRTLSAEDTGGGNKLYKLSFHVAAYEPDGRLRTHKDASVTVPLTTQAYAAILQQGLPLQTQLEVSPGKYQLRVAVRDLHTGLIGTVDVPLILQSP